MSTAETIAGNQRRLFEGLSKLSDQIERSEIPNRASRLSDLNSHLVAFFSLLFLGPLQSRKNEYDSLCLRAVVVVGAGRPMGV